MVTLDKMCRSFLTPDRVENGNVAHALNYVAPLEIVDEDFEVI